MRILYRRDHGERGSVERSNATGLGTIAAGTTVTSGAALQLQGGIAVGNETLTLDGTGISNDGALRNISGNNSWAGTITINSTTRINSDFRTLTLDVASGNAITGSNDSLQFGGAGNVTINDVIATGTGTLTKDGTQVPSTLGGTNTYTGATTVNGGALSTTTFTLTSLERYRLLPVRHTRQPEFSIYSFHQCRADLNSERGDIAFA